MQDIKFNTPATIEPPKPDILVENKKEVKKDGNKMKTIFTFLLALATVGLLSYAYINHYRNLKNTALDFYAVFLDNNQVYFGKIVSQSEHELVLKNVYYLAANSATTADHFKLVKLGDELHGPTDNMMVNMSHVVFYEKLRPDSKVVESIKNQP